MPLLDFWKSNPQAVDQLTIEQVVSSVGNGVLQDNSICSEELRAYLAQVTASSKLASYVEHCLSSSFNRSGMVLQDLVNELGRRLDYSVTSGRYQGTPNLVGFDGIWVSPEGHTIIVEVKTTDAYRISLDTVAAYRDRLLSDQKIKPPCSILLVVGRQDTGELEAQVRGSRHAWDVRLISAEALIKLVRLKEGADAAETGLKIRSLLAPVEYTRLDKMIDVMFTAATDVETAVTLDEVGESEDSEKGTNSGKAKGIWQFTESKLLEAKRELIVAAASKRFGSSLIKRSRALYWSADHSHRVACTISKRYTKPNAYPYWYAYHPQWDDFLREGMNSVLALGCMDLPVSFAVPWQVVNENLCFLNTTTTKDETYWHIHLIEGAQGSSSILLPKKPGTLSIDGYRLPE